jgi:hypothetical protein
MTSNTDTTGSETQHADVKIAGLVLASTSMLIILAMGHHPSGGHGVTPLMAGLSLGNIIHAVMIILVVTQLWGLTVFTRTRGFSGWALVAILTYAVSVIGHVLAGTINGFVVPGLAASVDRQASHDLFVLLWESNQAFATLGVYATSAAILFWSIDLLTAASRRANLLGGVGLVCALGPAAALFLGVIGLNVSGAFVVYSSHVIWTALVGAMMFRRQI